MDKREHAYASRPGRITTRRRFLQALAVAGSTAVAPAAWAQGYPDRPLRLIVPFPPSGSTDIVARTIAERLGAALGQNVVVDNRPGATGAIGLELLARAEPDGHTIGLGTIGSIAINPVVNSKLPWDPLRDFAPVGYVGSTPFALLVNPSLEAKSVADFLALAKRKPGQVTYATGGNGGSQHLASVLLAEMAGVDMLHVPYKGSGPAFVDLISGQVDAMIEPAVSAAPHIKSGKVRALALTGSKRSDAFPGLPLVADTLPGYDVSAWFALFAPARTPATAIERLNRELGTILRDPQVVARLAEVGVDVAPASAAQLGSFLKDEIGKWREVVKKANIAGN